MENHPPSPFVGVQKDEKSSFLVEGLPETAFLFCTHQSVLGLEESLVTRVPQELSVS